MAVLVKSAKQQRVSQDPVKNIGSRLRAIRKQRKITLIELAESSGVDAATISRIETGRMVGTLESHLKLSRALGAKLAEVYAGLDEAQGAGAVALQPASKHAEVYVHHAGKSSIAMLTTDVLNKKLMPILITIEPGGRTHQEEARVGTERFLYILDGEVDAKVGESTHRLKRGASLYFDASLQHQLRNVGSKTARALSVVTPPLL